MTRISLMTCGCCAVLGSAHADIIMQSVGDIDWNAAMWGSPAAVPISGNDYVSAAGVTNNRLRVAATGTSSTFGGDSITIVAGTSALLKNQNGAIATVNGDFTLDGGGISYGPNGGPHAGTLDVVNFVVTGTGSSITPSGNVSSFTIDGSLTGDGDLDLLVVSGTNLRTVTFTDVGTYTGNLSVANLIRLDFGADHTFTGGLTLLGGAVLNVDQSLTFSAGALVANGVVIPPGTYSGASLFDLGANFEDGGGTLVVSGSFPDSDSDGLPDFYEDVIINFDFNDAVDGYEDVAGPNDLPLTTDFDNDGRTDAEEYAGGVTANQTDPTDPDGDDDGLLDGPEVAGTNNSGVSTGFGPTDPFNPDSDADGYTDGVEVRYGSNANNGSVLPGVAIPIVNGGFESPQLLVFGEGLGVAGGTVPGWSAVVNDFYILDSFPTPGTTNPSIASEGFQFATAVRNAPEPDVDPSALVGGADASMSMRQDIDVSSFATEIDAGARTFLLDFDWFDNDAADLGVVTISFLDGSGMEVGHPSVFKTFETAGGWTRTRQPAYPLAGTRTIRITVAADKNGTGNSTVRNIHFDNFVGRLVHFDSDNDQLPDSWEQRYGFSIDDPSDAGITSDTDSLTNLQEFLNGTNPFLGDTDGDGIDDATEVANGSDPLDAGSPAVDIQLGDIIVTTNGTGQVTGVEVIFSGLNTSTTYRLMRGTDLQSFPDQVDSAQPGAPSASFFDASPPAGKAFYRLESQ